MRLADDSGVTMVEYGLVVLLIALVAIGLVALLGDAVRGFFTDAAGRF